MTDDGKTSENELLRRRVEELEANWRRALADYQNLEKRVRREKEEWTVFSNQVLIARFLPVLDSLEKAASHISDEGLNLALSQFKGVFFESGVTEIEALGRLFDPAEHECVETVGGEEDLVVEVVARGYRLHDRIIRPARVKVGKKDHD